MGASHYGSEDERINRLHDHLVANRVKLSIRRGMMRFAFHLYNNRDDVERVLDLCRDFLARGRAKPSRGGRKRPALSVERED